jgi:glycerophosphoryl diester phosphodiesterase
MRIIAHRGASVAAPENTLRSFALAKDHGAQGIEIDVQATADDRLVVFHDRDVTGLCGGEGVVRRMTLDQLRGLRVADTDQHIPTLEEVIRTADRPGIVTIEVKTYKVRDVRVADLVGRFLRDLHEELRAQVVVSSFHPFALLKTRRYAPRVRRGLLTMSLFRRPLREMWARRLVGASELHVEAKMVDAQRVAAAHAAGREIVAWTVNDPAELLRLRDLGVDGVMTDLPDVARRALEEGLEPAMAMLADRYPDFELAPDDQDDSAGAAELDEERQAAPPREASPPPRRLRAPAGPEPLVPGGGAAA